VVLLNSLPKKDRFFSRHGPLIVIGQEAGPPVRSYVTKTPLSRQLLLTSFPQSIITNPFVGITYNHVTEDFHFLVLFLASRIHFLV
jgi:hypothetical protein